MKKVYQPVYTDEQRIQRVWDVIEIKNVMARHAYYHAFGMHMQELEEIWVKEPENRKTASFGQNWGYMMGFDKIYKEYGIMKTEDTKKKVTAVKEKSPDMATISDNSLGVGESLIHSLSTPYIEVAGDGKTAQAVWYSPGYISIADEKGVNAAFMCEKYYVDFAKEEDETEGEAQWKIWHLFVGTEFTAVPGEGFGGPTELELARNPQKAEKIPQRPESTEDYFATEAYTMKYNYCWLKKLPEPYYTFAEVTGYGPEGDQNYDNYPFKK